MVRTLRVLTALVCGQVAILAVAGAALAAEYPTRSIQWIVMWRAGGGMDSYTRVFAKYMEKELGQKTDPRRINAIVLGKRAITADTALRLARYLGLSERFWINLQARYDLEVEKDRLGSALEEEVRVLRQGTA